MGKTIKFSRDDAGALHKYLKELGLPVISVSAGGGEVKVEISDTATPADENKLKTVMSTLGWFA